MTMSTDNATPNATEAERAYAAYERVQRAIQALRAAGAGSSEQAPSDYWKQELANFEYLAEASRLLISKLRHHCYHVTGLKVYEYQKVNPNRFKAFHARFLELLTAGDTTLLVPESPILGGFGYEIDGALYNVDTLKYFEVMIGLDRSRLVERMFRGPNPRRLVWEVGGGWGGLGYQFKTLFPDTTYVITDFPELFLFSAVYLQTAFPEARLHIAGEMPADECLDGWQEADFVFLPNDRPELIEAVSPDLTMNTVSFQEMTTKQVRDYVEQAARIGCPFLYSYNRDRSIYNHELTNVRHIIREYYRLAELPLLNADYTAAVKGSPTTENDPPFLKRQRGARYRHVLGYLDTEAMEDRVDSPSPETGDTATHEAPKASERPRVGIGMPVYNGGPFIAEALDSILGQTFEDFVLVILDDGSSDDAGDIAARYAERDPRVHLYRNKKRTGMIAAWRRAFELVNKHGGKPELFAWASDHDVWHSKWLGTMVSVLDADRKLALAYPLTQIIDDRGVLKYKKVPLFSNHGLSNTAARFMHTCRRLRGSGNMVYGLFRSKALKKAGVFREALLPDRLLMIELSLHGQARQIFSSYWYRRRVSDSTLERQRETLFRPGKTPPMRWWPWPLAFARILFSNYVLNRAKAAELARQGVGPFKFLSMLRVLVQSEYALLRKKERKALGEDDDENDDELPADSSS